LNLRRRLFIAFTILVIGITLLGISFFQNDIEFYSAIIGKEDSYKSSQGKIYHGLNANYTFDYLGATNASSFNYIQVSPNLFEVTWLNVRGRASWIENKQTRTTSNSNGSYGIREGSKTFIWLFTNISLGDLILIGVGGVGDRQYRVTDEFCCNYKGIGEIEVWVVQDLSYPGIAWYEKSTGILINGTFVIYGANVYEFTSYELTLLSSTIFFYYQDGERIGEISKFNLLLFLLLVMSFIALVTRKKEEIIKKK